MTGQALRFQNFRQSRTRCSFDGSDRNHTVHRAIHPRVVDSGVTSVCLAVVLALVNALPGALFGARRHQLGELRAVFGYPPISAVGEPRKPRETGCREPTS